MLYAKALREHDLDPVDRPKLEVLERNGSRPTKLRATVEVRPPIELHDYKGVVGARSIVRDFRRRSRTQSHRFGEGTRDARSGRSRPARIGDLATLDYRARSTASRSKAASAEAQTIELNEGRFVPGFATGIVGMQPGERRDVEARFPEDYPVSDLAGKTATFAIALHELKEFELPPIDDDFAGARFQRHDIWTSCARTCAAGSRASPLRGRGASLANAVMDQLVASHDVPLPATMVENEIDRLMEDAAADSPAAR